MGLYNAAAWLGRRDQHLAVNAVLYSMLTIWEQRHVAHHLEAVRRCRPVPVDEPTGAPTADERAARAA
jgi:hypothetical protein